MSAIRLSEEQALAVNCDGHALVTACPGSGKTRVLTCRLVRGLCDLQSSKHRVVALTFTNRAADEIKSRLDQSSVDQTELWAGTIHSFALEWVLRPYAPYLEKLRKGFSVADEFYTNRLLRTLKQAAGKNEFFDVDITMTRAGAVENAGATAQTIAEHYRGQLKSERLLDYDDVLYCAFRMLQDNREIAETLSHIVRLICVDEVQDTQDLQFGILSLIAQANAPTPTYFLVGDPNQSIYESLGAVSRSGSELMVEFGFESLTELGLTGNYRSSQRIIDYYRKFRPGVEEIRSLSRDADGHCLITFTNQSIGKDDLAEYIATIIDATISEGTPPSEICVLAPQWWIVRSLARKLVQKLPDVDFDAPGLSPLHALRESVWFKIARLFITHPEPTMFTTRIRWAGEVLRDLEDITGSPIQLEGYRSRKLLRLFNSIQSSETEGLPYLRDTFSKLMDAIGIDVDVFKLLSISHTLFFEKAEARLAEPNSDIPTSLDYFRKVFRHPSGVLISTCHGVKGEEYDTVICYGLLQGYLPNWDVIINGTDEKAHDQAAKLLYVICSRAKRTLHLISESGRKTKGGNPYRTTANIDELEFDYDRIR